MQYSHEHSNRERPLFHLPQTLPHAFTSCLSRTRHECLPPPPPLTLSICCLQMMTSEVVVCCLVCRQVTLTVSECLWHSRGSEGNCSAEFQFCLNIQAVSQAVTAISHLYCSPHTIFIPTLAMALLLIPFTLVSADPRSFTFPQVWFLYLSFFTAYSCQINLFMAILIQYIL